MKSFLCYNKLGVFMRYLYYYLIIINVLSFIIYGIDKYKAIINKWRFSEKFLLLLGLVGGSVGSLLGMIIFRHKTKKIYFYIFNILMLIIYIWGGWIFLWK
jgi:uncharacterized membrane protein YsdA (DUF1294 family)